MSSTKVELEPASINEGHIPQSSVAVSPLQPATSAEPITHSKARSVALVATLTCA